MADLRRRLEALEAQAPAAPLPADTFILIRVVDGKLGGRGALPDAEVVAVRDGLVTIKREQGETVRALCRRAAVAGAKARTVGAVCTLLAAYSDTAPVSA